MGSKREPSETEILEAGRPIELLCVKGGFDLIRSRIVPNGTTVIVRTGLSKVRPVPGEIFTLQVERTWVFGHTRYAKGLVRASRLDVLRLDLEPLGLQTWDLWDPAEETWLFEEQSHPIYEEIRAAGPRPRCEMEQVLPEEAVKLRWEEDPIVEAADEVFRRMVWLNPHDNQGARFTLWDVEAGRSWEEAQADEVDA